MHRGIRSTSVEHMIWDLVTFQFCFRGEDVQNEPFYGDNPNGPKDCQVAK